MLIRFLILVFLGTSALAGPKEDAKLLLDIFVNEGVWNNVQETFPKRSAKNYRSAFLEKNITIQDPERFQNALSEDAAIDGVKIVQSRFITFIQESYGTERLVEIAAFFRTSTGQKMVEIAKEERLFRKLHAQTNHRGPIQKWPSYLSQLDRARYQTFANTSAGTYFVKESWAVRAKFFYDLRNYSHWPKMPLNRQYIIDILLLDDIFKFPNRTTRTALIRELRANLP